MLKYQSNAHTTGDERDQRRKCKAGKMKKIRGARTKEWPDGGHACSGDHTWQFQNHEDAKLAPT